MATSTAHTADECPHPTWCLAHTPCTCAYAATQPHTAAGGRYRTDHDQDDDDG